MTEIYVQKINGALYPAGAGDRELIDRYPVGSFLRADVVRPRNYKFHKMFFAMLSVGFDAWEPPEQEFRGLPVQKNFERFRKDVVIAAGFYSVVANLKGEVRAEAESISFASMDEDEFSRVYNAVANVILQRILTNYTRADLDEVVDKILNF